MVSEAIVILEVVVGVMLADPGFQDEPFVLP